MAVRDTFWAASQTRLRGPGSKGPPPVAAGGKAAAKFLYDSFALVALCEARGHRITLERDHLPSSVTVQGLTRHLRCARC